MLETPTREVQPDHAATVPSGGRGPLSMLAAVARYTTRALIGAYALSLVCALALRLLVGEPILLLSLLYSLLHLLVIPAPLLIVGVLLAREWGLVLLLVPGALAGTLAYGPDLLPKSAPAWAEAAPQVTLLSFNLRSQGGDVDAVIDVILAADADLVALQELTPPAAQALAAALAAAYPHSTLNAEASAWTGGQGLFSRYPILNSDFWETQQGFQRLVVDVGGRQIVAYNVHAAYPLAPGGVAQRRADVTGLLDRAAADSLPVVLLGDFNFTPFNTDYDRMAGRFTDAQRAIGRGHGWTFTFTRLGAQRLGRIARLDYVFYDDEHFAATDIRVWPDAGGSDHNPVLVTLALR